MTQPIDTLNTRFGLAGLLHFVDSGAGLPVAEIHTPHASARVALQGAQVLAFQPAGQQPVLWVSKAAVYEPGKGVRGGVPVCWPWFGARDGLPAHGFVRTRLWEMREATQDAAGQVVLRLGTTDDASTRTLWDFAFDLELVVTVGQTLTVALVTKNTGTAAFTITDALHSYFCVSDIAQAMVQGLDGCAYLDKVQNFAKAKQTGAVAFTGETDRIYFDTTADCLIDDKAWSRSICVAKQGSSSTVVWNPGSERAKTFADMAAAEFKDMLCVETCNAGPDQVTLAPGQQHTLTAAISVA
ncbi:MAG: D-hexose-6-phosphate mutarotase [Rhodoferax sp.]|uniref:D-hexose-6-phosphate mutarotase n=1 Tax=Rhodoferax sp. TaxID=50421 RepID=UPI00260A1DCE|nr:D-hexose-6-phosphate mutarotase [Rhodoferax sp.]MDD2880817.1 D-hexose-6-phosphate mutarotase [Rhodoferax sp.]